MSYALLADLTLVLHAMFILFVVFGGFLVLWRQRMAWLHIPCALWGALIEFKGWVCPLTYLENDLRLRANAGGYEGGFIDHYLVPLIYPQGLTSEIQILLGVAVLVFNALTYTMIWRRLRNRPG